MSQLSFDDEFGGKTLAQARVELEEDLDDGTTCQCCEQHAQRYRWSLYRTAVWMLVRLYRRGGTTLFVPSKVVKRAGDGGSCSHLKLWGLVEHEPERRPDGGKSGLWRVTARGERFLLGQEPIPKYVWVYNGAVQRYEGSPKHVYDILDNFDFREHMGGFDEEEETG